PRRSSDLPAGVASVAIAAFAAERGHLHRLGVNDDRYGAELDPGGYGAREQALNGVRRRVGGHIPVVDGPAQECVPHAAAHHESLIPAAPEHITDPAHRWRHRYLHRSHAPHRLTRAP